MMTMTASLHRSRFCVSFARSIASADGLKLFAMEIAVIDRENERVISLREVPKHVPSRVSGKRLSQATVWRWALRPNNPLETFCTPGGRFTSIEAIDRFIERCSAKANGATGIQQPLQPFRPSLERAKKAGDQLRELIGHHSKFFQ
jgi:hypothetical protein